MRRSAHSAGTWPPGQPAAPADVLSSSQTLVSQGQPLEAIDLLTRANRACRATELETALVKVRHEAFPALVGHDGRGSWPPDPPGELEAAGRPPEVGARQLDARVLADGIVGHGALLVRGLAPAGAVDLLADGIDRAFAAFDARARGEQTADERCWFDPLEPSKAYPGSGFDAPSADGRERWMYQGRRKWVRAGEGVLTADSPRVLFDLLEVLSETGVGDAIAGYLGERPVLSVTKCTLRRVGVDSGTDWHQDGAFLGGGIRTVNVWLALSDCGEDAPGLDIVPRRLDHVVETGTGGAKFDWSVGPDVAERIAGPAGVHRPRFGAGDALLFDDLCLHRTAVESSMSRVRRSAETWCFAPSTYPDDQIPLVY